VKIDQTGLRMWRLDSQRLGAARFSSPVQAVAWLCGVQAQDYRWAKWSVGLRLGACREEHVERALQERQIVRTWLFRGTLHFVAAVDLGWLNALLAPGIIQGNARRYGQLGLDNAAFSSSQSILQRAIEANGPLTRSEIKNLFEKHGVSAEGQQLPYLLQRASLDRLICHGPLRSSEPTFALISEWLGAIAILDRVEALGLLADRYFSSHGPATLQDFIWWSGLNAREARHALESALTLSKLKVGDVEYWAAGEPLSAGEAVNAHLLPPFDDYLLGYKDRSLVLDAIFAKRVNAGGGMPKPTLLLGGKTAGVWSHASKVHELLVTIQSFRQLEQGWGEQIAEAADELSRFLSVAVRINLT
jgi:hypothetical protein